MKIKHKVDNDCSFIWGKLYKLCTLWLVYNIHKLIIDPIKLNHCSYFVCIFVVNFRLFVPDIYGKSKEADQSFCVTPAESWFNKKHTHKTLRLGSLTNGQSSGSRNQWQQTSLTVQWHFYLLCTDTVCIDTELIINIGLQAIDGRKVNAFNK